MIANVTRTIEPTVEPVTLDEAKAHLRLIDFTEDDVYITTLISVARRAVEDMIGRALIDTTFTQTATTWQLATGLLRGNARMIDSLKYDDVAAVEQTVDAGEYELVAFADGCAALYLRDTFTEPDLYAQAGAGRIRIEFTAGYGAAANAVPQPLTQAVLYMITHLYDNRAPVGVNVNLNKMPFTVEALSNPYKIYNI